MAFITNLVNTMSKDELASAGTVSDNLRESGTRLATIKEAYSLTTPNYTALIVNFETSEGTAKIFDFGGKPSFENSSDEKEQEKFTKGNERLIGTLSRIAKAAGFKDISQAVAGAVEGTNDKGATEAFTRLVGKKLHISTYKEIQLNQAGDKAYVSQVVDSMKLLNEKGLDGMGRDRVEAFNADMLDKITIDYRAKDKPIAIAKLAEEQEKALGSVSTPQQPAPVTEAPQQLSGMPEAPTQATIVAAPAGLTI